MRSQFSWYLPLSEEEVDRIWADGLLTLDTNFLLDMYRYNERTRNSLLTGIESFGERVWLSNQAATEFFRNRIKVICSNRHSISEATKALSTLEKALNEGIGAFSAVRILHEDTSTNLRANIELAITTAKEAVATAEQAQPDFLDQDSVLARIMQLFDARTGLAFSDEDFKKHKSEAERRIREKVPPGYLDDGKDGDRRYGDYFLWRQILEHAKLVAKPIIYVTSERKEDWWERHSGLTVGPRSELLREASEVAQQKILIYQTDQFLKKISERASGAGPYAVIAKDLQSAIDEIRALEIARGRGGPAVRVIDHHVSVASPIRNYGILVIELLRPVPTFTATGHFSPELPGGVNVLVKMLDLPDQSPTYKLSAGTGQNGVFHVHLTSRELGGLMPAGLYFVEYQAESAQPALFKS